MSSLHVHVEVLYARTLRDLERLCATARRQGFTDDARVELDLSKTLVRLSETYEESAAVQS